MSERFIVTENPCIDNDSVSAQRPTVLNIAPEATPVFVLYIAPRFVNYVNRQVEIGGLDNY